MAVCKYRNSNSYVLILRVLIKLNEVFERADFRNVLVVRYKTDATEWLERAFFLYPKSNIPILFLC